MNYVVEHSILGAIVCALFFTLCNYGLEQINWLFLALIPVFIFIKWIYTPPSNNECDVCQESKNTYDCSYRHSLEQAQAQAQAQANAKASAQVQVSTTPGLNCPAKPLTLATKCGISRYY